MAIIFVWVIDRVILRIVVVEILWMSSSLGNSIETLRSSLVLAE
jgi:hypothetical protein